MKKYSDITRQVRIFSVTGFRRFNINITEWEDRCQNGQMLVGMPWGRGFLTVMNSLCLRFGYKSQNGANSTEASKDSEGSIQHPYPVETPAKTTLVYTTFNMRSREVILPITS